MKGALLIVVALVVGYMGVTGKYKCFGSLLSCLAGSGSDCGCKQTTAASTAPAGFPTVAPLSPIPPLTPPFIPV